MSDPRRRDAYLSVCRVLVEAGSNSQLAREFFVSKCFAATFHGLEDCHEDAALSAACSHPAVVALCRRHLASGFPVAHKQGTAHTGEASGEEEQASAAHRRPAHERCEAAVRVASEILKDQCSDAKIFNIDVMEKNGDEKAASPCVGAGHPDLAVHLGPYRRVQAVSIAVSWNDSSLRGIEFLCGQELKDLHYYRL